MPSLTHISCTDSNHDLTSRPSTAASVTIRQVTPRSHVVFIAAAKNFTVWISASNRKGCNSRRSRNFCLAAKAAQTHCGHALCRYLQPSSNQKLYVCLGSNRRACTCNLSCRSHLRARKSLPYQDIYSGKTQAHSATNYFTLDIPDRQRPVLLIASWPQSEHVQPLLGRPATNA